MYRANFLVSPQQVIKSPGFEGKSVPTLADVGLWGGMLEYYTCRCFFVAESQGQKKISDLPVFNFI